MVDFFEFFRRWSGFLDSRFGGSDGAGQTSTSRYFRHLDIFDIFDIKGRKFCEKGDKFVLLRSRGRVKGYLVRGYVSKRLERLEFQAVGG